MFNNKNVIIQKINLYDLELQGNSSSDEEEENVAKNQQKQPSISTFLTKKSPRQQSTENGSEKLIECEVSFNLDEVSSSEAGKVAKSPEISRKSEETTNSSKNFTKSPIATSSTQKSAENSLNSFQLIQNQASNSADTAQKTNQPTANKESTKTHKSTSKSPTEVVIKEELIEVDDSPVIQQTWQDLDQHSFIKQENELMVPPDSLDGENIMEDEIEEQDLRKMLSQNQDPENAMSGDSQLKFTDNFKSDAESNEDSEVLDDKLGFFYKESDREDVMTSQDIPVDFDDNLMDLEDNPAKRMRIDYTTQSFTEISTNSTVNSANLKMPQKFIKIHTNSIVKSLPKGITVKRTSGRQVACKSTSAAINSSPNTSINAENPVIAKIGENLTKIGETFVKFGKNFESSRNLEATDDQDQFIVTTIKDEPLDDFQMDQDYTDEFIETPAESEPEKLATNSELAKSFTKNMGIVNKVGEIANQIAGRIISKRGEQTSQNVTKISQNSPKPGVSPMKFGLDPSKVGGNFIKVAQISKTSPQVIVSTKVIQNPVKVAQNSSAAAQRLSMPSTSYFMPQNFLDMDIKKEKLDDEDSTDPSSFLETKIKEEDPDDYFTPTVTSKPLNSTVTSTAETIVSTKIVTLPAANMLKTRKIIVIKKPVTPGGKEVSGHSIQRALKSQMRSSPGAANGPENARYIIRTVSMPNKMIKIENGQKSSLQIASVSSAKPRAITYPKSEGKITADDSPEAIYRCQKCHLHFSLHSEYTDHIKEHRIPQGIVFNEKRVIRLDELQKMNAFQCSQCSAGFPTLEKLSAHENRHKSEFICKLCGKSFLQLFRYKEHLAQHENKNPKYLECSHCDKKFLKQVKLDEHVANVHGIQNPHICGYCDLKFSTNSLLQDHQKSAHTKKTALKCGLCNYETYVKQNFEKHASMHMRYVEKLNSKQFFKCDQCPQSFREMGVLEMHKQHMHS